MRQHRPLCFSFHCQSGCIYTNNNPALYQSILYQVNNAVYIGRDDICVDSGNYASLTGAKFIRGPTNPCGEPSICLMDKKAEEEQEAVYRQLDGWDMYIDNENDISYVMDPESVNKEEFQKAINAGKEQNIEFLKKNCTFTVQPKYLFHKEKWVYRK